MFKKLLVILFFLFASISCNSDRIFVQTYTFDDYSWSSDEKLIFPVEIDEKQAGKDYEMIFDIRYVTGFSYKYLNLLLIINRPDGSQGTKEISIQLITEDKKYRGSGMGDIWDFEYTLSEPVQFKETGTYEIEIKPLMGSEPVNFINEIGLQISHLNN